MIYIKKNIKGYYVEFPEKLSEENFDNIGNTYQDFLDNKWILLNDELILFHKDYPLASILEVLEMTLAAVEERTLEDAKQEMLLKIALYDTSSEVNGFEFEGIPGKYWFTVLERLNYKQSVEAAKILNKDTLSFYVGNISLTVSTEKAEYFLAVLQDYADKCFIVTKKHLLEVMGLLTIEEVDNYPFKSEYPTCPVFNLE